MKYRPIDIYKLGPSTLIKKALLVLLLAVFCSCKHFVEVPSPSTTLVSAQVFTNSTTATAAVIEIYNQMQSGLLPYYMALYTGLSGDELKNFSSTNELIQTYTNSLDAGTNGGLYQNVWHPVYNMIYQTNAVIEGLSSQNGAVPTSISKQLSGEAYFIRGFWNFYLVNLFGEIPLITSTSYKGNSNASRKGIDIIYQQIIKDLQLARINLTDKYVGSDDTTSSNERVRPCRWVADALLSRVYLSLNNYDSAEYYSNEIIQNSNSFSLETDLNDVFLKSSKEAIWQLMVPQPSQYNTPEGEYFILNQPPQDNLYNCTTLSDSLLRCFDSGDLRRQFWIDSVVDGSDVYFYPFKYKIRDDPSPVEYSTVFRLAEQILIRAEARIHLNKIDLAISDINLIRHRAGLTPLSNQSVEELASEIIKERRVELFTEWGFRWIDLKRSGTINSVMPSVTAAKGGTWSSNWQLYPIPQIERNNDPNLTQNMGY